MKIITSKTFKRQCSKLNEEQRESIEDVVWELRLNPTIGVERKGRLRGFWYYDYKDLSGRMRLSYQFDETTLKLMTIHQISRFI